MTEASWKPTPEAENFYRRWLAHLHDQFTHHQAPEQRDEIVRDELHQIYLGRPQAGKAAAALTTELASRILVEALDPANVSFSGFEPDPNVDADRYAARRPLIWFWLMFDRSPLGLNDWLGSRFRCMLAQHIFAHIGKGVRIGADVRFRYGYNLTIPDNCTIGRGVFLDDSQPLSLSPGSRIDDGQRYPR